MQTGMWMSWFRGVVMIWEGYWPELWKSLKGFNQLEKVLDLGSEQELSSQIVQHFILTYYSYFVCEISVFSVHHLGATAERRACRSSPQTPSWQQETTGWVGDNSRATPTVHRLVLQCYREVNDCCHQLQCIIMCVIFFCIKKSMPT